MFSKTAEKITVDHFKNYRATDRAIRACLDSSLSSHTTPGTVTYICRTIKVARPTFYDHYHSISDAIIRYEEDLITEFVEAISRHSISKLPASRGLERLFELTLLFIGKHEDHFKASYQGANLYTIYNMFDVLCPLLPRLDAHHAVIYRSLLSAIIENWVINDRFDKSLISRRVREMMLARNAAMKLS